MSENWSPEEERAIADYLVKLSQHQHDGVPLVETAEGMQYLVAFKEGLRARRALVPQVDPVQEAERGIADIHAWMESLANLPEGEPVEPQPLPEYTPPRRFDPDQARYHPRLRHELGLATMDYVVSRHRLEWKAKARRDAEAEREAAQWDKYSQRFGDPNYARFEVRPYQQYFYVVAYYS